MGSPTIVVIGLVAAPLGVVLAQHAHQDGGLGEQLAGTPVRAALGLLGLAVTVTGVVLLSSRVPPAAPAGLTAGSVPTPVRADG